MPLPLKGKRVLDLSRLYPGPLCSLLLSDLGCEVIKIEDVENGGDSVRLMPPLHESDGISLLYHALNRGKTVVSLNLKKDSDREQFWQLVRSCHVVLESYRPGVLEKLLGISNGNALEELRKYKSDIILARISAYGQNAPDNVRNVPAHDMNSLAHAGVLGIQMSPSDQLHGNIKEMSPLPAQLADIMSAYSCALQITAAICEQQSNSNYPGCTIDVSMFDASLSSMIMPYSILFGTNGKQSITSRDILSGTIPAYDIYPCKDQTWLTVACLEPHFWKKFINLIGLSKEYESPQHLFAQGKQRDSLKKLIQSALSRQTAAEWEQLFMSSQLPIIRVRKPEELLTEPLISLRHMIGEHQVMKPALDYSSFLNNRDPVLPSKL